MADVYRGMFLTRLSRSGDITPNTRSTYPVLQSKKTLLCMLQFLLCIVAWGANCFAALVEEHNSVENT